MGMQERNALSGNVAWREFMNVIDAGRGGGCGRVPRGGLAVGANPTEAMTQLPGEWDADVIHASHVIYHYGTPIAWRDGRDGGWVVPDLFYSAMTSGVQNRIREHLGNFRTTVKD